MERTKRMTRSKRSEPAETARGLAALDAAELHGLIERLERSESDLTERVARQAATLDTPVGAPRSDPLYQKLFFALAGLREQLAGAHRELSRRSTARARPSMGGVFSRRWSRTKARTNDGCFAYRPRLVPAIA
jgi:hypothetical protein